MRWNTLIREPPEANLSYRTLADSPRAKQADAIGRGIIAEQIIQHLGVVWVVEGIYILVGDLAIHNDGNGIPEKWVCHGRAHCIGGGSAPAARAGAECPRT